MDILLEQKLTNLDSINDDDLNLDYFKKGFRKKHIKEIFIKESIKEKKFELIEKALNKRYIDKKNIQEIADIFEKDSESYFRLFEIENSLILRPQLLNIEYIDRILVNKKIKEKRKLEYIDQLCRNIVNSENINYYIIEKIFNHYPNSKVLYKRIYHYILDYRVVSFLMNIEIKKRNNILKKMEHNFRQRLIINMAINFIEKNNVNKFIDMSKIKDNKCFEDKKIISNLPQIYRDQINFNSILENF